jgi:uncharacterized protein with PIN domain
VFDAQAIVAFFRDEPAAGEVEQELREPSRPSRISSVNVAEVVDVMTRIFARPVDGTLNALAMLEAGGLEIITVDASIGLHAGELHAHYYHRESSPLSMADCVALSVAAALDEPLMTSDPPLAAAARAEGFQVLPLPDSQGRRPAP